MTDFARLISTLATGDVAFILVGGVAATVHGSARLTQDVDVVYARDRSNVERLAAALAPLHPVLRGAPSGLPFKFDAPTIAAGLNFTLTTDAGALDLLGEISGGGTFETLVRDAMSIEIFGRQLPLLEPRAVDRDEARGGSSEGPRRDRGTRDHPTAHGEGRVSRPSRRAFLKAVPLAAAAAVGVPARSLPA